MNMSPPEGEKGRHSNRPRPAKERPCDACRRRKSRCVKEEGQEMCVLCKFHNQECTYVQEPIARKRKPPTDNVNGEVPKKSRTGRQGSGSGPILEEYDDHESPTLLKRTLGLQNKHHSQFVGSTAPFASYHPVLLDANMASGPDLPSVGCREVDTGTFFFIHSDADTEGLDSEPDRREAIERLIQPHGEALVKLYFRIVHPSFPILHKGVWLEKYARSALEFTPASLASVYSLASNYWTFSDELANVPKPDMAAVWKLGMDSFESNVYRPKLSTVQCGLLLSQYQSSEGMPMHHGSRSKLTAHLVSLAYGLGLHLDPARWDCPQWEIGLRRRLAWSLFMQDKWLALHEGRPPLIQAHNWAVQDVAISDFPEITEDDEEGSSEVEKGRIVFTEFIALTKILSDVLDQIFSLRAAQEIANSPSPINTLLQKVKPLQIQLREWFSTLPESLRMETPTAMKLSSTGYLRLAYLAVEVSIHRRIILALSHPTPTNSTPTDLHLLTVIRAAAQERFLSALAFVDGLKAQHLTSFWYCGSSACLMLIASFGHLLLNTAVSEQERRWYEVKLREFKWTLKVNCEAGAKFMRPALGALSLQGPSIGPGGGGSAPTASAGASNNAEMQQRMSAPLKNELGEGSPATVSSRSSFNITPMNMTDAQQVRMAMPASASPQAWISPDYNFQNPNNLQPQQQQQRQDLMQGPQDPNAGLMQPQDHAAVLTPGLTPQFQDLADQGWYLPNFDHDGVQGFYSDMPG